MSDADDAPGLWCLRYAARLRSGTVGAKFGQCERERKATIYAMAGAIERLRADSMVPAEAVAQLAVVLEALHAAECGEVPPAAFKKQPKPKKLNARRKPTTNEFYASCIAASDALFALGRFKTKAAADRAVLKIATPAADRIQVRGWANENTRKLKSLRERSRIARPEFASRDEAETVFMAALDKIFEAGADGEAPISDAKFIKQWQRVANILSSRSES